MKTALNITAWIMMGLMAVGFASIFYENRHQLVEILKAIKEFFSKVFNGDYKKSKDKPGLDKFFESTYRHAFPGGMMQIHAEAKALLPKLKGEYSREFVESLLLTATSELYLRLLPPADFKPTDIVDMLVSQKGISRPDAIFISNFVQIKYKSMEDRQ